MDEASRERDVDSRAPHAIAASLRSEVEGGVLLLGTGQYSPYVECERVTLLRVDKAPPEDVWDKFVPDVALLELISALRSFATVYRGEVNTMYATPWFFAWTAPPDPFRLYDRKGLLVEHDGIALQIHSRSEGDAELCRTVAVNDINNVLAWISDDWVKRGVSIVTRSGEKIFIAEEEDLFAQIDPTYDGINLMCDTAWAAQLGKALAKGVGVAYVAGDSVLT